MVVKLTGHCAKIVAFVFTTLFAPLLVNLTLIDIKAEKEKAVQECDQARKEEIAAVAVTACAHPGFAPADAQQLVPAPARFTATTQILVEGVGPTAAEALQDGLRAALRQAVVAEAGAQTWARQGQALCEVMLRGKGFVIGWQELASRRQRRLLGTRYYRELAVEVSRANVANYLRGSGVRLVAGW